MARFCTHCGARNEDDAAFCEQCGQPLTRTQPQPADPPSSRSVQTPPDPEIVPHKPASRGLLIGAIAGALLIVLVVVAVALTLGGAAWPSNANFSTAIQHRFDTHDPKCMFNSNYPNPGHDTTWDLYGINGMSHALAHAGLLSAKVYRVIPATKAWIGGTSQPAETLYSYALTELGKRNFSVKNKCFGFKRRVVAITNYVKEDKSNYEVDFTYRYVVPAWARNSEVVAAVKQTLDFNYQAYLKSHGKPIKKQAYLTLTHNGWRAAFMDF